MHADASLSSSWLELEALLEYQHVRGILALGAGVGHARYRAVEQVGMAIFANDDDFLFRVGAGIGFAPFHLGPVRPVPYFLYSKTPESTENTGKHAYELGLDVELEQAWGDGVFASIVIGAALLHETGLSYADFKTNDTYQSEYDTTGFLVTLGVHFLATDFGK